VRLVGSKVEHLNLRAVRGECDVGNAVLHRLKAPDRLAELRSILDVGYGRVEDAEL